MDNIEFKIIDPGPEVILKLTEKGEIILRGKVIAVDAGVGKIVKGQMLI